MGAEAPRRDTPVFQLGHLRGPLRIADGAFVDDDGPVLPLVAHAGDLLSRLARGHVDAVETALADIAGAGFDGVRTWTVLGGSYWVGREVGPWQASYWDVVDRFVGLLIKTGLRWLVSQGDLNANLSSMSERCAFMSRLAARLSLDLVLGVDGGNETLWNGESDPTRLRDAVRAFRDVLPCAVWSLTSPGGETAADLDPYSGSVFDVHGYRGGRVWDKIRHIFSITYESKPACRLGVQSEPFGVGRNVSSMQGMEELDGDALALAAVQALCSRQAWVWFSSAGVITDGMGRGVFDAGETFPSQVGFAETCAVREWLPRDVMTWPTLCHGGASQAQRIYAVPAADNTRADHTISQDGRFVVRLYGPRWRECYAVRDHHIEKQVDFGAHGRVVVGRVP